ncbi:MAG: serine protease [Thermoproteota archaeon]|nr:serine protease [Thermoproteota archaeon]
MSSPVSSFWIYNTMLRENQWGGRGTGFLVFKPNAPGTNEGRVFLITNKHVLHDEPQLRESVNYVTLHLNVKEVKNTISSKEAEFPTNIGNDTKSYREHPSQDVDVIAFDITQLLVEHPLIESQSVPYGMLATKQLLEENDIKIGDEILVIGYPLRLKHRTTNFPLVRTGIISTRIGEELEDEKTEKDGTTRKRTLRGFLIDGAIIPGSSGSPVVPKPLTMRNVRDRIQMQTFPVIVLGIIAESRYAPIGLHPMIIFPLLDWDWHSMLKPLRKLLNYFIPDPF